MQQLDWVILITTLLFIVLYGAWKTRGSKNVQDFIRGGSEAKWWTIGLSVMATQASAITFLSTPGQAYHDGMKFVQFYFGVPIAVILVCMIFIPIYYKLKVYTAYEFLEKRFDQKTRTLTAMLFLINRGLSAGITIFAPSIVLSAVLGWNLVTLNIIIGVLVIIYTVTGGTKAVSVTQKQQMAVIFFGMFVAFFLILSYLPEGITFTKALEIAGASGKMNVLDFSLDPNNRYTFWSGILGGSFLAVSYFGTDQSQVQRYLSGKSVKEMQLGLIFNGFLKVPMQFFILLVGVMVFVFYQFNPTPIHFNPAAKEAVEATTYNSAYQELEEAHEAIELEKSTLQLEMASNTLAGESRKKIKDLEQLDMQLREEAKTLIATANDTIEKNDKDYVFIHFILNYLPTGLIGLLLAVILSAAMSSTASELNALGSTTTIDLYKRNTKTEHSEKHYVAMSKWFTLLWGIVAIFIASVANLFDNLIQLVNIIGSIFYGNVLGIFIIAFFLRFIKGSAVFIAAIITQVIVILIYYFAIYQPELNGLNGLSYLWLNLIGCSLVIVISTLLQWFTPQKTVSVN